jgi:hypothetical protein
VSVQEKRSLPAFKTHLIIPRSAHNNGARSDARGYSSKDCLTQNKSKYRKIFLFIFFNAFKIKLTAVGAA